MSMVPDADVLSFYLGIPYEHPLGHRGFTHSILFALLSSIIVARMIHGRGENLFTITLFLFLATVSHGLLDAITTGGLGVGFFIPFDDTRYFFSFRPILVSPIGIGNFIGTRGLAVLMSEFKYVWIPLLLIMAVSEIIWRSVKK